MTLDERTIADALVGIVCRCDSTPGLRHKRGYPECATARAAARAVLALLDTEPDFTDAFDDQQMAAHNEAMNTDPQYRDAVYQERH